jgi:hypothetical protein
MQFARVALSPPHTSSRRPCCFMLGRALGRQPRCGRLGHSNGRSGSAAAYLSNHLPCRYNSFGAPVFLRQTPYDLRSLDTLGGMLVRQRRLTLSLCAWCCHDGAVTMMLSRLCCHDGVVVLPWATGSAIFMRSMLLVGSRGLHVFVSDDVATGYWRRRRKGPVLDGVQRRRDVVEQRRGEPAWQGR